MFRAVQEGGPFFEREGMIGMKEMREMREMKGGRFPLESELGRPILETAARSSARL
jgi:hypothetical protein